jgi:hypothetical protein
LAPSGRAIRLPLTIVFPYHDGAFTGGRLYFDMGTLRTQLGVGDLGGDL